MQINAQSENIKSLVQEAKKLASDKDGLTISDKQKLVDSALKNDGKLDDKEKALLLGLEDKKNVEKLVKSVEKIKSYDMKNQSPSFNPKTDYQILDNSGKPLDLKTGDIRELNNVLKQASKNKVPEKDIMAVVSGQLSKNSSMESAMAAAYTYTTLKSDTVKNMKTIDVSAVSMVYNNATKKPDLKGEDNDNGLKISGNDFAQVADKIKSGDITFKMSNSKGMNSQYDKAKNQFEIPKSAINAIKAGGKNGNIASALLVHESMHAVFDNKGKDSLKMNEEALGHLVQTQYIRDVSGDQKISVGEYNNPNYWDKEKFSPGEEVFNAAANYLDKPDKDNLSILLNSLDRDSVYTLDQKDLFRNNGIN